MVYSGGVRSFIQFAAVCALALNALPSVHAAASTSTASVSCQVSDGDKNVGIQSISDKSCTKGGLGCYSKHCRYCKVLDTDQSKHLDTCLSHGVAFTPTTPVVVSNEPCHASSGDVAAGISAVTDSSCLTGGLGCYNDHCRYCKVTKTPASSGFMACSKLDKSYSAPVQTAAVTATASRTNAPVTNAPTATVTDAPITTETPTGAPTSTVTNAPITTETPTEPPTEAPTSTVTEDPVATETPTDAPTSAVTEAPITTVAPTGAPTSTVTEAPITTETPTEPPTEAPTSTVTEDPVATETPTDAPTSAVMEAPITTETPTGAPISAVTDAPSTTEIPTEAPTSAVTEAPSTTETPTESPTEAPTSTFTDAPITTETPNEAPSEAPTSVVTDTPATDSPAQKTCSIVPSAGDIEGGVTIVTDPLCASGGIGCLNDVCRSCKLKTTPHSDPYMDCALVNGTASVAPVSSDVSTDAPTETPASSDASTDASTETSASSDVSTDVLTETPASSDASTETSASSDDSTDVLTETPASSDVSTAASTETSASSDVSTEVPTVVPDAPVVHTEAPASPTTCTLVASADDSELGISVATDSSCKPGGVGCIDDICRFCKVMTTTKSAPYVDCALLQDGSSDLVVDSTVAPTDAAIESPVATTETPIITDAATETPASDVPSADTDTPAITETPTSTVETAAPATTITAPEQPTCGIIADAGDIAAGVRIATDSTCSAGGLGCINDLCRFCKVETTTQSETYVDCSSLAGFSLDSKAPVTSDPLATPAPIHSCELVASSGDASVGIRILTDFTCADGGVGCISDVCRFCKVTTSIQSAAFVDCVTVDGYVPETEIPVVIATPDATTSTSSEGTCSQIASEGDLAVGVDIATDATCRDGGVGCTDDVCRFCQISTTVQSEAFVSCTTLPGYTPRTEAPADTTTTTDAPIVQPSCDLVVSAGDAAVGISITGDAACAVGGVGCIDSVCRFCKVTTTVQSAAFVDCTSVAGFTLATDALADTSGVASTSTLAPTVSASCGLVASEGDAAVGIDITADNSCQLGGVGCIDSVCRFCKVKTTEQSAAFVDCPGAATGSSDEPVDVSTDTPDVTSSLPADAPETPVDTTATDIPYSSPVDSTTSDSDEDNSDSEAPPPADAPSDTTNDIDVGSSEASQGGADTTQSTDATESPEDDNDTLTDAPKAIADATTTEAPTKTPAVDDDDVDWEGSESAEEDLASTYDDSDVLEGV